ncbi:ADP-ribosylation factor-like protein 11 [Anguilla rostrata]|uniref:ADP-ribosylation factor-like protein 11 n=1 Tax=Anguilla anguilla TaxID=7936 RepID=UPI0015A79FF3|nr:ADP-ribosylation factor-like protein 11 [Anguilla anguilla]
MGKLLSRQTERPPQVVLMGLDGAGKSTLLSRLQWGEKMETSPTVGFNVGTLEVEKGVTLTVWDVGGQGEMRANWKYYLDDCQALVFVVDGVDRERLGEAQKALRRVLREEALKEVPLMVLVNKKDLPNSMTIREVSNQLDLPNNKGRDWQIQACSAYTGLGLQQAFLSVAKLIKQHQ